MQKSFYFHCFFKDILIFCLFFNKMFFVYSSTIQFKSSSVRPCGFGQACISITVNSTLRKNSASTGLDPTWLYWRRASIPRENLCPRKSCARSVSGSLFEGAGWEASRSGQRSSFDNILLVRAMRENPRVTTNKKPRPEELPLPRGRASAFLGLRL